MNRLTTRVLSIESAPSLADASASRGGAPGARATLQALLVTLLAWACLVLVGLGGTVFAVSQTIAAKLAASAQHLQRQGGTSLTSRAERRQLLGATAAQRADASSSHGSKDQPDSTPVVLGTVLVQGEHGDHAKPSGLTEARAGFRHRAPLSRAPPRLA